MTDEKTDDARQGLGRAIEVRRVQMGLKRNDLKERSGLSYPYISELERGRKEPSAKALRQIADALEIGVADLVAMGEQYDEPVARENSEGARWEPKSLFALHRNVAANDPPNSPTTSASWRPPEVGGNDELAAQVRSIVREELGRIVADELRPVIAHEIRRALGNVTESTTEQ